MFSDLLKQYKLKTEYIHLNKNVHIITKENWDYPIALEFQKSCVQFVKQNPTQRIFIITSHPHCFTNGRGLQKGLKAELVDFKEQAKMPLPIYSITRGGGLTFHYPGQYIVYPIIKLNTNHFSMKKIIYGLLEITKKALEKSFNLKQLDYNRDLLGLWSQNSKLASLGIATENYVTFHGMALHLEFDQNILNALRFLHPCGIRPETYSDVKTLSPNSDNLRPTFHQAFLEQLTLSPLGSL